MHAPVLLAPPLPSASGRQVVAMSFEVSVHVSAAASGEPAPVSSPPALRSRASAQRAASRAPASASTTPAELLPDVPAPVAGTASPAPAALLADDPAPVAGTASPAAGPIQRDLSPLAAARTLASNLSESSGAESPPGAAAEAHEEARLAEGIPGLVRDRRALDRSLGHLARDLQSAALRPWDLLRQPLQRARYRYRGVGFDAVIAADGSIRYRDKDGIRLGVSLSQAAEGNRRRKDGIPTEAIFAPDLGDLSVWSEKLAGNDPHATERRTFLQRTRALREYLRARAERGARKPWDGGEP